MLCTQDRHNAASYRISTHIQQLQSCCCMWVLILHKMLLLYMCADTVALTTGTAARARVLECVALC